MFILHLDVVVKQGGENAFEAFYCDTFYKAVTKQIGFSQTQLLKDKAPESRTHRLVIAFESEELQKKWMASELHQDVSAKLQEHIAKVCSADYFDAT